MEEEKQKAYRITEGQKNAIEKQPFASGQYFNPVQDINGHWFIFEIEMEHCVKNKGWARSMLAEYIPPIVENII